jgi:hypothetical protein
VPRERYLLARDRRLPLVAAGSVGVEQQFGSLARVYATYGLRTAHFLLRGHNLNAPVDRRRPDPESGNVVEARDGAALRARTLTVSLVTTGAPGLPRVTAAYVFSRSQTNTQGAFAVPADAERIEEEWGPIGPGHVLTASVTTRVIGPLALALTPRWRSGLPYTITTGRDDNGDGLFTDRPPGSTRNAARTTPHWEIDARLSFVLQLGRDRTAEPRLPSAGTDAESARAGGVTAAAPGARYRVEVFASARNVTNTPSYAAFGSVIGSPFFGQPTVALDPRRVELGARVSF